MPAARSCVEPGCDRARDRSALMTVSGGPGALAAFAAAAGAETQQADAAAESLYGEPGGPDYNTILNLDERAEAFGDEFDPGTPTSSSACSTTTARASTSTPPDLEPRAISGHPGRRSEAIRRRNASLAISDQVLPAPRRIRSPPSARIERITPNNCALIERYLTDAALVRCRDLQRHRLPRRPCRREDGRPPAGRADRPRCWRCSRRRWKAPAATRRAS